MVSVDADLIAVTNLHPTVTVLVDVQPDVHPVLSTSLSISDLDVSSIDRRPASGECDVPAVGVGSMVSVDADPIAVTNLHPTVTVLIDFQPDVHPVLSTSLSISVNVSNIDERTVGISAEFDAVGADSRATVDANVNTAITNPSTVLPVVIHSNVHPVSRRAVGVSAEFDAVGADSRATVDNTPNLDVSSSDKRTAIAIAIAIATHV